MNKYAKQMSAMQDTLKEMEEVLEEFQNDPEFPKHPTVQGRIRITQGMLTAAQAKMSELASILQICKHEWVQLKKGRTGVKCSKCGLVSMRNHD